MGKSKMDDAAAERIRRARGDKVRSFPSLPPPPSQVSSMQSQITNTVPRASTGRLHQARSHRSQAEQGRVLILGQQQQQRQRWRGQEGRRGQEQRWQQLEQVMIPYGYRNRCEKGDRDVEREREERGVGGTE